MWMCSPGEVVCPLGPPLTLPVMAVSRHALDTHSCRLRGAELGTLDTWETGPYGL